MLDIKISDTVKIVSDDKNYIVQKRNRSLRDIGNVKAGERGRWKDDGYFQDWNHLSEYVLHLHIRRSNAKTLEEVCSILKQFKMPKTLK